MKNKKNVSISEFNFFFHFFFKSKALLKCIGNVDICSWWRILFHLLKYDSILSVYFIFFFFKYLNIYTSNISYSLVLSVNVLVVLLLWWWWNNSVVYIMEKAWRYFIYHDWHNWFIMLFTLGFFLTINILLQTEKILSGKIYCIFT